MITEEPYYLFFFPSSPVYMLTYWQGEQKTEKVD